MKLDDFLKLKEVRCVNEDCPNLTVGKTYEVLGATRNAVKTVDDEYGEWWSPISCFEPVLDPAENPLQEMKLTPELEASEPKFKVGDKVYLFGADYIEEITKIIGANFYLAGADFDASVSIKEICHATTENYEQLQATFPDIEFEAPPKPLSGDALVKAMLAKGIKNVLCFKNGTTDKVIIDRLCYKGSLMTPDCVVIGGLTPIDWYTDEPLTQAVLDE